MTGVSPRVLEVERQAASAEVPALKSASSRLESLDVFRGLTMILLISHGFGMIEATKGSRGPLASQFDHAEWIGCTLWDLIQPAFTFIVGAAMPFAIRRRLQSGQTTNQVFGHVLWRAAMLILLSNVLSNWTTSQPPRLQLINVLCQIAFGYVLCFLILRLRFAWQVAAGALVMVLHQGLFFAFPGPNGPFDMTGNIGAVLDKQLLGYNYSGYYTTLNALGNAITILFGAWTGMMFAKFGGHAQRLRILLVSAGAAIATGLVLAIWIPMVKRLWTASFTFYSAGWVLLALAALYSVVEVKGWKRWAFPAIVVGTNSIFIYSFSQVLRGWLSRGIGNFTGHFWFLGPWGEIPHNLVVLGCMWYLCFWLYQRRIFFRL